MKALDAIRLAREISEARRARGPGLLGAHRRSRPPGNRPHRAAHARGCRRSSSSKAPTVRTASRSDGCRFPRPCGASWRRSAPTFATRTASASSRRSPRAAPRARPTATRSSRRSSTSWSPIRCSFSIRSTSAARGDGRSFPRRRAARAGARRRARRDRGACSGARAGPCRRPCPTASPSSRSTGRGAAAIEDVAGGGPTRPGGRGVAVGRRHNPPGPEVVSLPHGGQRPRSGGDRVPRAEPSALPALRGHAAGPLSAHARRAARAGRAAAGRAARRRRRGSSRRTAAEEAARPVPGGRRGRPRWRRRPRGVFRASRGRSKRLDPSLEGAVETAGKKIAYQLEQLAERARKAAERKERRGVESPRAPRRGARCPDGDPGRASLSAAVAGCSPGAAA